MYKGYPAMPLPARKTGSNEHSVLGSASQTQAATMSTAGPGPGQTHYMKPFKMGSFAKSLMAKAQSESSDCQLSPNTIQRLVNPMRSQLGLPCLSLLSDDVENTEPHPEVIRSTETTYPNRRLPTSAEKCDSQQNSVKSAEKIEPHSNPQKSAEKVEPHSNPQKSTEKVEPHSNPQRSAETTEQQSESPKSAEKLKSQENNYPKSTENDINYYVPQVANFQMNSSLGNGNTTDPFMTCNINTACFNRPAFESSRLSLNQNHSDSKTEDLLSMSNTMNSYHSAEPPLDDSYAISSNILLNAKNVTQRRRTEVPSLLPARNLNTGRQFGQPLDLRHGYSDPPIESNKPIQSSNFIAPTQSVNYPDYNAKKVLQKSTFTIDKSSTPIVGNQDNNSNTIPEIAARIPASGNNAMFGDQNNGLNNGHGRKARQFGTPVLPRAAPTFCPPASGMSKKKSGNSGWKFGSETVDGKEYLVMKQLGKGGCGEVSLVIEKDSRQLYALKKVNLAGVGEANVQECINEVEMLIELKDSDLVIRIHSWEINHKDKTMKIVMEYGQCDLNTSVKSAASTLLKLKAIWERMLMIVNTIHLRGIVHADLKPANFVWVGDNLKIIDFGIASRLQNDNTSIATFNPKGTLNFISPETLRPDAFGRSKISPKSDIWSLGCILYFMVYGKTPFQDLNHPAAKMNAIVNGCISFPPLPEQLELSDVVSVLKLCFQVDSKKRPTTSELLNHPFLSEKSAYSRSNV